MWKMLTAQIRNAVSRKLFPELPIGCHKDTLGIGDLLYIKQHILKESKTRRKNVVMARIDYKKAYDMVRQM